MDDFPYLSDQGTDWWSGSTILQKTNLAKVITHFMLRITLGTTDTVSWHGWYI